jgi:predicted oxidoreductase
VAFTAGEKRSCPRFHITWGTGPGVVEPFEREVRAAAADGRVRLLFRHLGGLHTNLGAQVLGSDGQPVPGLYAAGEVAGFGGGGMHGYRALEGTFLGGCLFSGRTAGRHAAKAVI